jgi:two-component system, LytTR family, sensor kinase
MRISIDRTRFLFYLWVGVPYSLLGLAITMHEYQATLPAALLNNFWRTPYLVVINFIFFEYGLPYVKRRQHIVFKILLFLVVVWIQMMLYSFGSYAWRSIGIQLHLYVALIDFDSVLAGVSNGFPFAFFSMFFFGVIKHFYDHNKLKLTARQLLIEKQQAELNYLKSQTNPHFLFNTLNNIYSLARDKSDLAPESILRLSQILRFTLYETGGAYISIEQELKIISDYIALEQLRYDDSLHINFNHDIEDMKQALPPLLLIPLVENAFKHGVSETRNQPFVDIHLSAHRRQLEFIVKNSTEESSDGVSVKENIGLTNLRRQLELLYTDYSLSVHQAESVFVATLKINLASHV